MTGPRLQRGRKPGDVRVRVERPYTRYFRYVAPGVYAAKLAADAPTTPVGRIWGTAKRALFGRPLSTEEELTERLPKWKALPIFSSDVMSSVAYASEASLFTLLAAGTAAFVWLLPISFVIVGVLALVTISYRQTIRAYPNGGGSYIVAHANLGVLPGLVAAAALLTDYVLTVAVSVSSGVQALASAFPVLFPINVPLIVFFILFVMVINLRGIRETGSIFASPTYIFLGSVLLLIAVGMVRTLLGQAPHVTDVTPYPVAPEAFGLLLLMRAFADGSSAMTGTEAVANGVPAFKPPEAENARTTLVIMSTLLGIMFLGISFLAHVTGAMPAASGESVLSQIGRSVFGRGPLWYVLQFSTTGILILAAQTSFADFPRLSSILARDGFMPRQFAFRGERLAFNGGIVALAVISVVLVVAFRGRVEALIPLYAIGVFTAFTLSQTGMVRHWFKERGGGWRRSAFLNGLGAVATALVTMIFAIAKFALGAWIIILVVPVLVGLMLLVHRAYQQERAELDVRPTAMIQPPHRRQHVIVVAPAFTRAVVQGVKVARTMSTDVSIVHVAEDPEKGEEFRERVDRQMPGVPVVLIESPYRSLVRPFLRYLEVAQEEDPDAVLVVLIPELEPRHWWDRLLFNQNARRIRTALVGRPDIVVLDVPYRREEKERKAAEAAAD